MTARRLLAFAIGLAALLALSAAAFACGDNGDSDGTNGAADESSDVDAASGFIDEMTTAAEGGDLEAAEEAFESAHDPLHEVIEALEAGNGELAAELDQAVEHAEEAFAEGEEAEHVAEEAGEIAELLEQASTALGS